MTSKRIAHLLSASLASFLLPVLCLVQVPVGLSQGKTDVVVQVLTEKEVEELIQKAHQHRQSGEYAEAAIIWERLKVYYESARGEDELQVTTSLNNLGYLYAQQGFYRKAEFSFQSSLAIRVRSLGSDHPLTATSLNNLASLYSQQGLYEKAEPMLRRALEIREKSLGLDHELTGNSLNNLASLYFDQGLFSKAEPLLRRALAIDEKVLGPDHFLTGGTLNNLATVYSEQGLYYKAEPLFLRALGIHEKALSADHPATAKVLNALAMLYSQQGIYGKAENLFQRALVIQEKSLGGDHPDVATTLDNLAHSYGQQGSFAVAVPLIKRALAIRETTLGANHPNTAKTLNNMAMLLEKIGWDSDAKQLYQRALMIAEKVFGREHPSIATILNNLAGVYEAMALYDNAEVLYQRALRIRRLAYGADHPETITSLNNLGLFYSDQGNYLKAKSLLRRGLGSEARLIQRESPFMSIDDRLEFVSSLGNAYEAVFTFGHKGEDLAGLAFFSRLNRQGLLEEIEKRQSQLASLPGEQQQVAKELRVLREKLSSLSITPEQRKALRVQQEELEKQLYRLLPQLKPRVVEEEQVAAALPSDGVLIEFQRYQPFDGKKPWDEKWGFARYVAMVLKPNGSVSVVDLGDAAVLDEAITAAVSTARQGQVDAVQKFEAVSQLLLEPLLQATAGAKTWFISPDGELNRLPFAALQVPGGQGYLAEAVDLRLLTTGRELLDLQAPRASAKSAALVVADPAYDRNGAGASKPLPAEDRGESRDEHQRSSDLPEQLKWDPLPATAQEGETVKVLTGGSLLLQQQATAEAVKRTPAPKILHLATHAFYLPNQPKPQPESGAGLLDQRGRRGVVQTKSLQGESPLLRSGIALAGANQPNANPNDDGYLTALEVAQLSWEGTDLVVISACESGLGDLQVGEGVYGLKRAIAVAGARSSLLSLWKVEDLATAAFMKSFYQRLKEGKGKAEALAETQKEFRDHPIPMWREPYVWAAFQLSGDWGPVKGL